MPNVSSQDTQLVVIQSNNVITISNAPLTLTPVVSSLTSLVIQQPANTLVVQSQGIQGIQGPVGPPGSTSSFLFTQAIAAGTWIINHALGRSVHTTIFDSLGNEVEADVVQGSINTTTVMFSSPFAGTAILS